LDIQITDNFSDDRPALETQITQLWMLLDVSRVLNSTLDLDTLLRIIVEVATVVTESEAASILLLDEQSGELHFEAASGAKRSEVQTIVVPIEGSLAGWVVRHDKPIVVNDAKHDPRHFVQADNTTEFETRSLLGVPLRVKEKSIGVLEVINKVDAHLYTKHDLDVLESLSAQAAIAIENARLYKDLQDQMKALKDAQARLVQSEKLAAVGELVAGVAHELNNPLTSIIGFAELLQLNDLNDRAQEDLNKVVTQAQRAASIVRGLLDFARQHPPQWTAVQLNDILKSVLNLLAYELHTHNVTFDIDLAPDLPLTMADPHQLQQVFINLVNNARQAMSSENRGGQIIITTRLKSALPETNRNQARSDGAVKMLQVIITDDGPGILPEHLSRIFDPFFTTKEPGEGTGLGLSVCHGIVTEHGGEIRVDSRAGQGASFIVELPVTEPNTPAWTEVSGWPDEAEEIAEPDNLERPVRILVVDDEPDLLDVVTRMLQSVGYQVDTVNNGEAALGQMAANDYNLILCDVRMPGLSGLELFRQAEQLYQNLPQRLVFMTGDTVSPETRRLLDETGAAYLAKPFQPQELLQQVQQLVDEA